MEGFARTLSDADRSALSARGRRRRYVRHTRVFCEGDPSDFVLVILEGRVKLAVTTEDGDESLLGVRGPGDLVGELAALDSPSVTPPAGWQSRRTARPPSSPTTAAGRCPRLMSRRGPRTPPTSRSVRSRSGWRSRRVAGDGQPEDVSRRPIRARHRAPNARTERQQMGAVKPARSAHARAGRSTHRTPVMARPAAVRWPLLCATEQAASRHFGCYVCPV
jgi:CRP-like cAMP-binding protein